MHSRCAAQRHVVWQGKLIALYTSKHQQGVAQLCAAQLLDTALRLRRRASRQTASARTVVVRDAPREAGGYSAVRPLDCHPCSTAKGWRAKWIATNQPTWAWWRTCRSGPTSYAWLTKVLLNNPAIGDGRLCYKRGPIVSKRPEVEMCRDLRRWDASSLRMCSGGPRVNILDLLVHSACVMGIFNMTKSNASGLGPLLTASFSLEMRGSRLPFLENRVSHDVRTRRVRCVTVSKGATTTATLTLRRLGGGRRRGQESRDDVEFNGTRPL
ncbi:hypothetical protein IF2G_00080 [Cordyceps javanica]|nr:hypothetical protein IF2G_00080 [Cordyceps javanica]